ncbi:MDR family MFS transporter [Reinekea sp.]|jgi:EmrB/QacA subfamily drug resistance transporter|uniref:MDR family MFS transporter n=1 Tax=Reinekea sp. TaxID=1970455 RepID=UPI00398A156A
MNSEPTTVISPRERRGALIGVLLALFMAALDQTIVSTATPMIIKDLSFPTNWITWLTTSYLVTGTALLPIWGKLSDLYGRRPMLLTGIVIFVIASILCAIAQTPIELVLYRALQGVGSAAIFANAFAVVGDLFEPHERPKYQGLFGAMFGLSSVIGPWIGGLLTDLISWHWVFLVNIPVGAIAFFFIAKRMPLLRHTSGQHIDFFGAALLLLFVIPLLLALSLAPTSYAWASVETISMFSLSIIAFTLFIRHELKSDGAIVDLKLFANKTFGLTALASFVLGAVFLGSIVFIPLYMVNVLGVSATSSGATLTPLTLGLVFGNITSGQLVSRIGSYKPVLIPSLVALIFAYLWFALTLDAEQTQLQIIIKLVVLGIALGPTIPLYTQMMINAAPRNKMGVASASATFVRQMGSSVGLALLGTVFSAYLANAFMTDIAPQLPSQLQSQVVASDQVDTEHQAASINFEQIRLTVQENVADPVEQAAALAQVTTIENSFKVIWAEATRKIFQYGFLIVILGLAITLIIPEIPFSRPTKKKPVVTESN